MQKKKAFLWLLFLFCIIVITYFPVLKKLFHRWTQENNSYCFFVPLIFLFLCWTKRKTFDFTSFSVSCWGLIVLILAITLSLVGSISSLETLLYLGLYLVILALGITLYGKRTKHLIFPFFILFFIIPLPPFINRLLTFKLQLITSSLAVILMKLSGLRVFQEGNIINIGATQLQIAEACSGLRYFMPMILLDLLIGYFFLRKFWTRFFLFGLVPLICVLANALRVYILAIFYVSGHASLARGFFHYFTGWLVFMVAILILTFLALIFRKWEKEEVENEEALKESSLNWQFKKGCVFLFCLILIIGSIGLYYFPQTFFIPKKVNLARFPLQIDGWYGEKLKLSNKILKSLWADDYVYNVYVQKNFPGAIYVLIPYYKYQTAWHTAHTPQTCLLGGGWFIVKSGKWNLKVSSKKVIPIKYMWLSKNNEYMLATYFFFERGRVIISPWWHKFYLLWDGITRRRTDGALIRVEMFLRGYVSPHAAEARLKDFLIALWPILNKFI
ncbi:MAG: EpsI family protein [Thermodesulfobacteria bacterium]|nr:EpsI family protein [Thermodesulfobacteriota bacterium]